MKKLILMSFLLFFYSSEKKYRYKIVGKIYVPTLGANPFDDAVWYTDSIYYREDTLFYKNHNGLEVKINPPYKIYKQQ